MTWPIAAVVAIAAVVTVRRHVTAYLARRAGWANVIAWQQAAGSFVVPAGTLLYDESAPGIAAAAPGEVSYWRSAGGPIHQAVVPAGRFPLLHDVGFTSEGVPSVYGTPALYAHAHPMWVATGGSEPYVIVISFYRVNAHGCPEFTANAYGSPANGPNHWTRMGGTTGVQTPPTRSIANMRIFAGIPDPADPTRFALPFACDGGTGRFEFKTDVDVSDGGEVAPAVQMVWDRTTPATTRTIAPG